MRMGVLTKRLCRLAQYAGMMAGLALVAPMVFAAEGEPFVDDPSAQKVAVILVGASINDVDRKQLHQWGTTLRDILLNEYGYDAQRVHLLLGNQGEGKSGSDGQCNAQNLQDLFNDLSAELVPRDQLTIVLIGHGTGSGERAKFNIVGPDLTGGRFAELLVPLKTPNMVVVNTTAASHDFTQPLAAEGRVLVSATRSRAEKYDTVFPVYFIEGLKEHNADRDKNRRVSVLEAFQYAKSQVNQYFRERDILPSEHATLDDNGDGDFSLEPGKDGDGRLAEIAYLDKALASGEKLSPEARSLRAEMTKLERDVFLLRSTKEDLPEDEYWSRLEPLLIELAKTTREYHALRNQ